MWASFLMALFSGHHLGIQMFPSAFPSQMVLWVEHLRKNSMGSTSLIKPCPAFSDGQTGQPQANLTHHDTSRMGILRTDTKRWWLSLESECLMNTKGRGLFKTHAVWSNRDVGKSHDATWNLLPETPQIHCTLWVTLGQLHMHKPSVLVMSLKSSILSYVIPYGVVSHSLRK